ncbi:ficolin-2-like isoform X4 [Drosophila albomicans]|uniref:Ficolin-2-like isoform X4 n=1 Tax=Drosophila albomicans TaxID=7291 RepID=A0A9C6W803_DROAB|nr:ficolin-2-like isoform X4 [Drosophila albomicans]
MNIIQVNIFLILLIAYQVNSSCLMASKELGDQCSLYCYQVVKPLLQYVNTTTTMTQEQNELQQTIKVQAETIKNLNELMKSKDMQLEQQSKLIKLSESHSQNQQNLINQHKIQSELWSKFNESLEIKSETQQKLIDECKMELSSMKLEIQWKDDKIKKLQTENVKTNELQSEQSSSCIGRLTGFHMITIPKAQPFIVSCESNLAEAGTGWTVIQRRKDGSVDFNRTWAEYKEGFGNLEGEFFLGLEKIHLLTQSQPHELYILLEDFENETRYARYSYFAIGGDRGSYMIEELGTFSGDAEDGLKFLTNCVFLTADRMKYVNDYTRFNASGWWFRRYSFISNLNGKYAFADVDKDAPGVSWRAWKSQPLKYAQMMIRPITK